MHTPSIQRLIKKYGIRPRKKLGQHFLAAIPTMEKIVRSLEFGGGDTVVEIGAGLGVMTSIVARHCGRVFAIEKDAVLFEAARAEFGHIKNIVWINSDILDIDLRLITGANVKIVGNLPYNISSPVMFWMLENRDAISTAVVMAQREVALRIAAAPGGRDYGILSVLLQARADCKKLFDVAPGNFVPPPEVVSSVLRIDFGKCARQIDDDDSFKAFVKAAFGRRRKMLKNALAGARELNLDAARIDSILASEKIDGWRRPETLSVDEFISLSKHLTMGSR